MTTTYEAIGALEAVAESCTMLAALLRAIERGNGSLVDPEFLAAAAAYAENSAIASRAFGGWTQQLQMLIERSN